MEDTYSTDNQYEAGFLLANDIEMVSTNLKSNGFVVFTFANKKDCEALVTIYNQNLPLTISAKKLFECHGKIRNILHQKKEK